MLYLWYGCPDKYDGLGEIWHWCQWEYETNIDPISAHRPTRMRRLKSSTTTFTSGSARTAPRYKLLPHRLTDSAADSDVVSVGGSQSHCGWILLPLSLNCIVTITRFSIADCCSLIDEPYSLCSLNLAVSVSEPYRMWLSLLSLMLNDVPDDDDDGDCGDDWWWWWWWWCFRMSMARQRTRRWSWTPCWTTNRSSTVRPWAMRVPSSSPTFLGESRKYKSQLHQSNLESVRWNACVHRLDLSVYSHLKEF